jgi:hypothetical protein
MSVPFSSGKYAHGFCDRCGIRVDELNSMKNQPRDQMPTGIMVCSECLDIDHPQLQLGKLPISDPQALRLARPDTTYYAPGNEGANGSRQIQWGWNPVGMSPGYDAALTPNDLLSYPEVGTVTIIIS